MLSQNALVTAIALVGGVASSPAKVLDAAAVPLDFPPLGWTYLDCFTEATNTRALSEDSYFSDGLTVQKCADYCSRNRVYYMYFGVEYGRECYCGNKINSGSNHAESSNCNMACPGDKTKTCGGGNHLNIFQRILGATGTASAVVPIPTRIFSSLGCHVDNYHSYGRALSEGQSSTDYMTVENCATACDGFKYFGLEYGRECYCGNNLEAHATLTRDSDCNFPCAGNSAETCGAGFRINVYQHSKISVSSITEIRPTVAPYPIKRSTSLSKLSGPPS
ncbi:WSC domain-containing protein [Bisporella sp. PMI_857]|nr:WSC domain-containing protein [Bisporella sp. PMI_857]